MIFRTVPRQCDQAPKAPSGAKKAPKAPLGAKKPRSVQAPKKHRESTEKAPK